MRIRQLQSILWLAACLPLSVPLLAQEAASPPAATQTVTGERPLPGPEIKGVITARSGERIKLMADDGTTSIITVNAATEVKGRSGLFGANRSTLGIEALLNGLPVTVRTLKAGDTLLASQIQLRAADLKTARMIRAGTEQGFAEQTAATAEVRAATEALRGRMADIDQYNLKGSTNVYFDTGKWTLSDTAKAALCAVAADADRQKNALLLVVGYTDSVGDEEYNQTLSEKRAARVMNHLQQVCGWKPYRMLTPTGMAESDPAASNDTEEGKAQNRRVSVNILVSKAVDAM